MRIIVIEHMEDGISRWMLEEYRESVKVARERGYEVLIAGLSRPDAASLVSKLGARVLMGSARALCDRYDTIVLDPWAPRRLEPWEARVARCVVVGGIMGDHPPRGRTRLLSWSYLSSARRSLGPHQLSIDGAVKVAIMVDEGLSLDEVPLALSPLIEVEAPMGELEVELPYAYPLDPAGRPWIAEGVVRLLRSGVMWDESS